MTVLMTCTLAMFLPSLSKIWEQDVCPSLKAFEFANTSSPFEFGRFGDSSANESQETGFGTYDDAAYNDFDVGGDEDDDDGADMDAGFEMGQMGGPGEGMA